ncbi:MAG: PadR family transcriptional regulator [Patescibacteria group bacterium]|jgi:PadR family transcriptional regulator PadR
MRKNCSKVVLEKFFEPCVLYLLFKQKTYGYELQKQLEEHCCCSVNIGNLYRSLGKLEKSGDISKSKEAGVGGPERITYSLTEKGKELLSEWITELEEQNKNIAKLITNYKKLTHVTSRSSKL